MEHTIKGQKLSKEEEEDRAYRLRARDIKISRTRASVIRKQITEAYEIVENIRFGYLSDSAFRDKIVRAKKELESAFSDFLLSDGYWERRLKDHEEKTPKEYMEEMRSLGVVDSGK